MPSDVQHPGMPARAIARHSPGAGTGQVGAHHLMDKVETHSAVKFDLVHDLVNLSSFFTGKGRCDVLKSHATVKTESWMWTKALNQRCFEDLSLSISKAAAKKRRMWCGLETRVESVQRTRGGRVTMCFP